MPAEDVLYGNRGCKNNVTFYDGDIRVVSPDGKNMKIPRGKMLGTHEQNT